MGVEIAKKTVRGITCHQISPEQWQWVTAAKIPWTLELFGSKLFRGNRFVYQGLHSLADAVEFARGYDECIADVQRARSADGRSRKDMLDRAETDFRRLFGGIDEFE